MNVFPQPRLRPGDRVGPYEITEFLGAGGMGEVYRAHDPRLHRDVALKTLASSENPERLLHEARTASALNHPNIVFLYDVIAEGERTYLVMEYVAGRPLDALIPRNGMRVNEALRIASQTAVALSAAHAVGIVHRDIKPGNIMVSENGRVKVLDFGLAKAMPPAITPDDHTHSAGLGHTAPGSIAGTAHYMSPEQIEGRPVDGRSDIFSFGIVLYEMISGQNPFRRDSVMQTVTSILRDEPRSIFEHVPELPPEVERIVRRCLRKDPDRRFQTSADLRVTLDELRDEWESGSIMSPSPVAPVQASRVRSRSGIFALAIAALFALFVWRFLPQERPAAARMLEPTPLMSMRSLITHTTLSPDGAYVAFSWTGDSNEEENVDIYVRSLIGGAPLRLTKEPADEDSPAWSGDGTQIAFIRHDRGKTSLVVAPVLGGQERILASAPGETQSNQLLAWSPDSKWIVWARQVDIWPRLHRVSVESGEVKRLTPDGFASELAPAVAPDGRSVVYSAFTSNTRSELYRLPLNASFEADGAPRQLTKLGNVATQPALSPDGKRLFFSVGVPGVSQSLWEMPAEGGEPVRMPVPSEAAASPTVSRRPGQAAGLRFAFTSRRSDEDLWALSPTGQLKPLEASGRRDYEPHISPDGKKLAFTSTRSGWNEIWIGDLDGRNAVQLTNLKADVTSAAHWSPDGQRLVFISNKEGQTEVYLIAAIGGAPVRLTEAASHDSAPNWSRDGQWIYFGSDRTGRFEIFRMRAQPGAPAEQITREGGFAGIESLDGKFLYYAMRQASQGLWRMALPSGKPEQVIGAIERWGNLDLGRNSAYFVSNDSKLLQTYDFESGKPKTLLTLPKLAGFGLSVNPADGSVTFTLRDQTASELMVLDNLP